VVHSRILFRSLAGVLVAWFILASGPVSTSWHRGERRDAPSECVLIALPGNSFTFVRPPDLALRQFLIGHGDGIVDLLLPDSSSSVAVWLMTASGQPASFVVFNPNAIGAWEVKGRR
jgi:hypothetical protein